MRHIDDCWGLASCRKFELSMLFDKTILCRLAQQMLEIKYQNLQMKNDIKQSS